MYVEVRAVDNIRTLLGAVAPSRLMSDRSAKEHIQLNGDHELFLAIHFRLDIQLPGRRGSCTTLFRVLDADVVGKSFLMAASTIHISAFPDNGRHFPEPVLDMR